MDWNEWHDAYDDPESRLSRRLATVQARIREALTPQVSRIISVCAGQGRDLLGVLNGHPAKARLVELDRRNVATARQSAPPNVEVVQGDAALLDNYLGMAPADLVLMCGVFGNITDADIERTIQACRMLCANGGTVIWTRHRREPDLLPQVCEWFEAQEFQRVWVSEPDMNAGVGVHRFVGQSDPITPGAKMFTFVR